VGISLILIAISETTTWGWGSTKTLALIAVGLLFVAAWIMVELRSREPLIDMAMMRIRGVWTANLAAFLLGAGMYSAFIVFPEFAQLPKSTGFGFGASIVVSGLYLLPACGFMALMGSFAGRVARRYGSKPSLVVGSAITALAFGLLWVAHHHPYDMVLASALLGVGVGLAFAALGNLIVQAVPAEQTGVAGGMNTVMRTLGGALGAQISATFIANNIGHDGLPTVTGFSASFLLSTCFLVVCVGASLLIPNPGSIRAPVRLNVEDQVPMLEEAR
jgi:MFS family permease